MGDLRPWITQAGEHRPVHVPMPPPCPVPAAPASREPARPVYASAADVPASPPVRRMAARYGVDLREVAGTGVAGRITTRDVQAHPVAALQVDAARLLHLTVSPAFAADHTSGRREIAIRSAFSPGSQVTYDPYGPNPLAEDARQHDPAAAAAAVGIGPAPTMFTAGDLPAFTASGLDPRELRKLPWPARLVVAADPDQARVWAAFEEYQDDPEAALFDLGHADPVEEYRTHVRQWLAAGRHAIQAALLAVPVQRPTRA